MSIRFSTLIKATSIYSLFLVFTLSAIFAVEHYKTRTVVQKITDTQIDSNYAIRYYCLGNAYLSQGKFDNAIASYKNAVVIHPDFPLAHNKLGDVYRNQGKYDLAIASYQKAIKIAPNLATARQSLNDISSQRAGHSRSL